MSSTTLEQLRSGFEDIETYERAVVNVLNEKTRNHRERVLQGHRVSNLVNKIVEKSKDVADLYKDKDGSLEKENDLMSGKAMFTTFYERLKGVREYHRKFPNVAVVHEPDMDEAMTSNLQFSGEERFGKYLDLHEFYVRFLNIKAFDPTSIKPVSSNQLGPEKIDYMSYLDVLAAFGKVKMSDKLRDQDYDLYLTDLYAYLERFYRKTQPLVDLDEMIDETTTKFEKEWSQKHVQVSELYCEACNKQFASKGVYDGHLNGKKHKKALAAQSGSSERKPVQNEKSLSLKETKIKKLRELLTEVLDATRSYVELKQTRTPEELQAEIDEEEAGVHDDIDMEEEEEDEQPFYNPLNLPLGWDGKPIPYWLYKLHGLGVEFKCEICGNYSYWGRRAFDRHFQEWRHAHGMRCLKIPNTKHFHDITLIEDAINLYERIKGQLEQETWKAGDEEEFEDSEGNVLNKKTYEDLARQGLL